MRHLWYNVPQLLFFFLVISTTSLSWAFSNWPVHTGLWEKKAGFCQKPLSHIINMLSHTYSLSLVMCISPCPHTSFLRSLSLVTNWTTATNHKTLPTASCFLWQAQPVTAYHTPPCLLNTCIRWPSCYSCSPSHSKPVWSQHCLTSGFTIFVWPDFLFFNGL